MEGAVKLCALIYRGQVVEVSAVPSNHEFGEHGNHFHLEVKGVERHLCEGKPIIKLSDEGLSG